MVFSFLERKMLDNDDNVLSVNQRDKIDDILVCILYIEFSERNSIYFLIHSSFFVTNVYDIGDAF